MVTSCYGHLPEIKQSGVQERLVSIGDCRVVKHWLGETCIPRQPQRIVVLHDSTLLDPLLALGLNPIAVATYPGSNGQPMLRGIAPDTAKNLIFVGSSNHPDLETILQLRPDLIIGREFHQDIYKLLDAIAPTILIRWESSKSFKSNFYALATLLDRTQPARQVLASYQERIQQFHQAMGDRLNTLVVSLLAIQNSTFKTFGQETTMGEVLQDAGLQRPTAQSQSVTRLNLSLEQLSAHDADVIFLVHESGDELARYQKTLLWNRLEAVESARVYTVEPQNWIVAGPLGANHILDDLFKYLVKESNP
ncbi:ABC transporter substrate-binding protein [Myxacorys almedinensis]|uniref:ABC transporter substrate-binding protein n=1 Tax=Myxacorys almedinensis A TaxID=2690445 RepID=A0A8J7Z280_9CYAN|nr:ABC transporter substrate-binding protein [Myxacorys almedinensis]NDJ17920.1 ABC transporter substrate-binding protein [Myxacorys almedinensis A]